MINTKDILKDLGERLRGSNESHRVRLRAQLAELAPNRPLPLDKRRLGGVVTWLTFSTGVMAMLAIVIATHERPVAYVNTPPLDLVILDDDQEFYAGQGRLDSEPNAVVTEERDQLPRKSVAATRGVVDYEQDHGSMLEKTTTINLMTREDDAVGKVESLFTSVGGHLSGISNYGAGQPSVLTGEVPADSYFLFREQLHGFVRADRYITESLNAQDLIPSAIEIDENLVGVQVSIDELSQQIKDTKDEGKKTKLQAELDKLESQKTNLEKSRANLTDRADYVRVSVGVYDLPTLWQVDANQYEIQRVIAGFGTQSFPVQAWGNVLMVFFWAIQLLSVTFWLIIPLVIWLALRRRQRKTWKELE